MSNNSQIASPGVSGGGSQLSYNIRQRSVSRQYTDVKVEFGQDDEDF